MLHGRESLVRIIGKRRRTFTSHLARGLHSEAVVAIFGYSASFEAKLSDSAKNEASADDDGGARTAAERGSETNGLERVSCPVCGASVRGDDFSVNYHLELGLVESRAELTDEGFAKDKMLSTCCALSIFKSKKNGPCEDKKDTMHGLSLETFIVGRRFHEKAELQEGARIYVLRDPENARDDNAIKVFCEDQGNRALLGYLPRELAKYLSPLIDSYSLKFEEEEGGETSGETLVGSFPQRRCSRLKKAAGKGFILAMPKHPLDAVPIMLFCEKVDHHNELDCEGQQVFNLLWEKVLYANESVKAHPFSVKYQKNFSLMLEDVLNKHSHLFTNEEKEFLGSFCSLSDDGQRLLIRLYTRKATGYLCSFNSVADSSIYDMGEILDVLSVSEMRQISKHVLPKNGIHYGRKQELLGYILSSYSNGACPLLPKVVLEHVGKCVQISSAVDTSFWRIQRLFFLNGEQELSTFLLADIGIIKFPEYTCTVTRPIFKCRNDLLEYEEAVEVAQLMDEAIDENNMEMVCRCTNISVTRMLSHFSAEINSFHCQTQLGFFSHFSASWVYSKMLTLGVSVYEREHRYEDAIRLLKELLKKITCDSRRGYWTLRLSVDLEHLARFSESLSVAEEGVEDPWIRAGSKLALQRRVLRLGKPPRRWKVPSYAECVKRIIKEVVITGRPLTNETGAKNIFYGYDGELCGVEQLALQYYAREGGGWHGIHSESGIWMTIFGLLLWDVIFSDVPNVFRSKFQIAPLDLLTDDFYLMRKISIESKLQKIQEGMAEEMLITSFQLHQGTACHGINWDKYSLCDLRAAVSCIGGHCLASLCRHLAMDYKSWSSGMPDLLLWRFRGGDRDGGEAKLVEVKGPRDRLSEQQRAWIFTLMDCGLNTEVCKVSPSPKF
ncbi:Fanconi-associated nuclease 1 like [Apostasia shenzhenica]|uniref:Fanconi-associated nuclease n=1 Tax=Apostasia shenzhenica TaxID=1088818 RepID=A0A2I0BEC6_9ASPA|nr:Fanconi-associated nuclease 1 like [Apostasia shenzhenica]